MSKAYKNGKEAWFCDICSDLTFEEPIEVALTVVSEFTANVYPQDRNRDSTYYETEELDVISVYKCPDCGAMTLGKPSMTPVWVCGDCNTQFNDEYDAGECC